MKEWVMNIDMIDEASMFNGLEKQHGGDFMKS